MLWLQIDAAVVSQHEHLWATTISFIKCHEFLSPAQTLQSGGSVAYTLIKDRPNFLPVPEGVKNALEQHEEENDWVRVNGAEYTAFESWNIEKITSDQLLSDKTLNEVKQMALSDYDVAAFAVKHDGTIDFLRLDYRFEKNESLEPSDTYVSFFVNNAKMEEIQNRPVTLTQEDMLALTLQQRPFQIPVVANHACDTDEFFNTLDPEWGILIGCGLPAAYDQHWEEIGDLDSGDDYGQIIETAEEKGYDNIYYDKQGKAYGIRPATRHYTPNGALVPRVDKDLAFHLMKRHVKDELSIESFGPNYWGAYPAEFFRTDWLEDVPGGNTNSHSAPLMVYDETHNAGWMEQFSTDTTVHTLVYLASWAFEL